MRVQHGDADCSLSPARNALLGAVSGAALAVGLGLLPVNDAWAQCTPAPTTGDDTITCVNTAPFLDSQAGNDQVTVNGTVTGIFATREGDDSVLIDSGGLLEAGMVTNSDNDTVVVNAGGRIGDAGGIQIATASGADSIQIVGTVDGNIFGDEDNDTIRIDQSTSRVADGPGNGSGNIDMGAGDDQVFISDGSIDGFVVTSVGNDTIIISGGAMGPVGAGSENDVITMTAGTVNIVLTGQSGDDTITVEGGSILGNINGNVGNDVITIHDDANALSSLTLAGDVTGSGDNDSITITSGILSGWTFFGDAGNGSLAGDDTIRVGEATVGAIDGEGGDDDIIMTDGQVDLSVSGGAGEDQISISNGTVTLNIDGGGDNDTISMIGGQALQLLGGDGDDDIDLDGGLVTGFVNGEGGNDSLTMTDGTVGTFLGGTGQDTIRIQGGLVNLNVEGGGDNDTIVLSGAADVGNVNGDDGEDLILLNGPGVAVGGNVRGGAGNDVITITRGTVQAGGADAVTGGAGDDLITIDGASARIEGDVAGAEDNDTINMSDGVVTGSLITDNGADTGLDFVNLSGGSVGGSVIMVANNDVLTQTGGTIGGAVDTGTGNDTATLTAGQLNGDVLMDDGDDTLVVGEAFVLSGTSSLNGGAGSGDNVRIEVADAASRSFTGGTNDITGFEQVTVRNDTDAGARGTINLTGLAVDTGGAGTSFQASGTVTVNFANTLADSGTTTIRAASVTFDRNTTLTGNGTIDGTAVFNGVVVPGGFNALGDINVTGSAAFGANSLVNIDFDGTGPGTAVNDTIDIGGAATLAGTLVINFFDEKASDLFDAGDVGQRFTILTAAGGFGPGDFNLVLAPNAVLGDGLGWQVFRDGADYGIEIIALTVLEPATTAAFAAGFATLFGLRKRSRKRRAKKA